MTQQEEIVKTTFRLPKSLLKKVKHLAVETERSDQDIFKAALEEYLKGKDSD